MTTAAANRPAMVTQVGSRRTRADLYTILNRLVLVFFFASMIFDRSSGDRIGGLNLPTIAGAFLTVVALLRWRMPRDPVVWLAVTLIVGWVSWQWVQGASYADGVRMLTVLAMGLALGGTDAGQGHAEFQLRAALLPSAVLVTAFYFGTLSFASDRMAVLGIGANHLGFLLGTGVVLLVNLSWSTSGRLAWAFAGMALLWLPALWMTGSRSALLILVLSLLIGLMLRARRYLVAWLTLVVCVSVVATSPATVAEFLPDRIVRSEIFQTRYIEFLETGYLERRGLIERRIEAIRAKPWVGYGIDARVSEAWHAEHIGMFGPSGAAVGSHNGLVDYAIMGGLPLMLTFMLLYGRVFGRVAATAMRSTERGVRDLTIAAVMLSVLFVGQILTGEIYSKLGWWMFGFCLYTLGAVGPPARKAAADLSRRAYRGRSSRSPSPIP